MAKRKLEVRVLVLVNGELAYTALLKPTKAGDQTEVEATVNPNYNVLVLADMFSQLSDSTSAMYYMSEVKALSREAREKIERTLRGEDTSQHPF